MTLEYPPFKGGVAEYYSNLVEHWPENDIWVLTQSQKKEESSDNVRYKGLLTRFSYPRWLPAFFHIATTIRKHKIEYVLVGQILPLGTVVLALSGIFSFRYAVILHGMDLEYALKNKRKRKLASAVIKGCDKVVCGNSHTKDRVVEEFGADDDKLAVVNPGVGNIGEVNDTKKESLIKKYGLERKKVLLSLGRLVERKGFDKVIEAMPLVWEKDPDVVYVIGGEGEYGGRLRSMTTDLPSGDKDKIIFLGSVGSKEKWAWLDLADIFIMPSREINGDYEGFGIVYLEAGAVGLPVIAGDSGGVRDAVVDGENGIMANPEDENDITEAILTLIRDKEKGKRMGVAGKRRASKFAWEKQIKRLYKEIFNI